MKAGDIGGPNGILEQREAREKTERAAKAGVVADDLLFPEDIEISKGKVLCKRLRQVFVSSGSRIEIPQSASPKAGLFVVLAQPADSETNFRRGDVIVLPHYGGFPLPHGDTQLYSVK